MNSPRITVLMPVLNAERFLDQTLDSIWSQTYADFELLVVDDGSTDQTPDMLAGCGDPRLRVLRNSARMKLSGALNRGLDEARGEFVARMDADDLMRQDRLAHQVRYLEQHPDIGCCGGWVRTFGDGPRRTRKFPVDPDLLRAFALFHAPFAHPTVMFRRTWFEREGLRYNGAYYPTEDYELWARVLKKMPCGNLSRTLVEYRVHGQGMTGGEWSDMDAQTVRIQQCLLRGLSVEATAEEMRLHRAICLGRMPAVPESFALAEAWLLRLADANKSRRWCTPESMIKVLSQVWFELAMALVRNMGMPAWRLYGRGALGRHEGKSWLRGVIVRGAAMKAALLK